MTRSKAARARASARRADRPHKKRPNGALLRDFPVRPAVRALAAALTAAAGAVLLLHGRAAAQGVRAGLTLCGGVVIPSLFPFLAFSSFLTRSGLARVLGRPLAPAARLLFRLPGAAGAAVLLSCVGGYPVGGRMAVRLYESGQVTREQACRMLDFTVNAGPAMILSAVGAGMLGSPRAGGILLAAHLLAALLIGVVGARLPVGRNGSDFSAPPPPPPAPAAAIPNPADAFVEAVADAASGMLGVCAFVVLFSCVLALLPALPGAAGALLGGLLEVTTGCGAAAGAALGLPAISAMLGWGGLSVHCQVLSCAHRLRPGLPRFFLARGAHAALSFALCSLLLRLTGGTVETLSNGIRAAAEASAVSAPASAALLLMGAVLLCEISQKST